MSPVQPFDMSRFFAKIDRLKGAPQRWGEVVMREVAPEAERLASARAGGLRTKSGKPSRLGVALLERPSVDPLFKWTPQHPLGGALVMSGWAHKATNPMFIFTAQDRAQLLHITILRLKSWRAI